MYDIDFTENPADDSYRKELERLAAEKGAEYLHEMLKKVDPKAAGEIHANNSKRVIRALEYFYQTGQPISVHNEEQRQKESPYNAAYFVLTHDRKVLYDRIDRRVDKMMEEGLLEEVKRLKQMGYHREMVSMQGLGYKEILDFLEGTCTLEEAVYTIKRDTRHFAKRQLTWFRREKNVIWVDKSEFLEDEERILLFMKEKLQERGIIQ